MKINGNGNIIGLKVSTFYVLGVCVATDDFKSFRIHTNNRALCDKVIKYLEAEGLQKKPPANKKF